MIVFDASTLILLAKAELLEKFLESVGQPIAIPKEVERECCQAKKKLDALLIQKAIDQNRVKVAAVKNRKLLKRVLEDFPLGKGEAEAIVLAISPRSSWNMTRGVKCDFNFLSVFLKHTWLMKGE